MRNVAAVLIGYGAIETIIGNPLRSGPVFTVPATPVPRKLKHFMERIRFGYSKPRKFRFLTRSSMSVIGMFHHLTERATRLRCGLQRGEQVSQKSFGVSCRDLPRVVLVHSVLRAGNMVVGVVGFERDDRKTGLPDARGFRSTLWQSAWRSRVRRSGCGGGFNANECCCDILRLC